MPFSDTLYAPVSRLKENTRGRTFVVGDIHGMFDLLYDNLESHGFDYERDILISTGDLIDRGPQSEHVADFLRKPWVHAVLGNHESILLEAYRYGSPPKEELPELFDEERGRSWWLSVSPEKQNAILRALSKLPLAIEVKTCCSKLGIIHAEVPLNMGWSAFVNNLEAGERFTVKTCLWGRSRVTYNLHKPVEGVDLIFAGHTVQKDVKLYGNLFVVDTGAYKSSIGDGRLTLLEIPSDDVLVSAPAHYDFEETLML